MSLLVTLAAAAIAAPGPVTFHAEVSMRGDTVRLGDIADLSGLPDSLRARAIAAPVARVREGSQSLSTCVLAARARAAVPGLSPWLAVDCGGEVHVTAAPMEQPPASRFSVANAPTPAVSAGEFLTLQIRVGPVTVEREVRALQGGSPGGYLFVRTLDGTVLRAFVPRDQ